MSLETREIKLFGRDIPGFCRDIPGAPEKFEKKRVCVPVWFPIKRGQNKHINVLNINFLAPTQIRAGKQQ